MKSSRQHLRDLLLLLNTIGEATGHTDLTLHQAEVLTFVALREASEDPADSREIAAHLGLSTSGVSRAVASLGEHGRGARGGLGLLTTKTDLHDRRRKWVRLSRKGQKAMEAIIAAS